MARWRHVRSRFCDVFDRMRRGMVDSVRLIMAMIDGGHVLSFLGRLLRENGANRDECACQAGRDDFPSIDHCSS
ncbi:hypothetical protein [Acidisphaera sp. S103]|uniref:hypothetical protein n=1 Tax=Acidisphaera sp. S103 TaxID=1747223 RepID=UPI00131B8E1F|nr:hypothetical protein [Acidisphaera sp. S103]